MPKHVCVNGIMVNTSNYSSPVPVIGLYIAAVSLVCFVLIVCDVWAGFRSKKLWFPCRFFSFNSISLTLISVATKIPVDLTTTMPSGQDQLAKLSGTVFICMTLSFMLPSISINAEFESYANVTALSIFVVTVVVNICIQMATGVIFSFFAEHAIILFCMLFLLLRFWFSVISINFVKRKQADKNKDFIKNVGEDMYSRLKLCYLYSYHSCLQLYSCRAPLFADVGVVCITCSIVLVQATLRSLVLKDYKFCEGNSDYAWSMWVVLGSHILTVAAVTLVIGLRSSNIVAHFGGVVLTIIDLIIGEGYREFRYLFSLKNMPKFVYKSFDNFIYKPLLFTDVVITVLNWIVHWIIVVVLTVCRLLKNANKEDENLKELKNMLESRGDRAAVESWLLRKGVAELERWLEISKKSSLEHLTGLFSTIPPSEEPFVGLRGQRIKISSLSVVLIANAMMTMPSTHRNANVISILREVFEIIHFVDGTVNAESSSDRLQYMLAKSIHRYGLSSNYPTERLLEEILDPKFEQQRVLSSPREFFEVYSYLNDLTTAANDKISTTARQIGFFINQIDGVINEQLHPSNEVRYNRLQQLFVDMLHAFLAQLPVAVFTHILESPVEEYHKRVRLGLGFIFKLQALESHIRFSIPSGCGIISLFETQT